MDVSLFMNSRVVKRALKQCVKDFGEDILSNSKLFRNVICDLLPSSNHKAEQRLIVDNINSGIGHEFLNAAPGREAQQNVYDRLFQDLRETYNGKTANLILQAFAYSLGWEVRSPSRRTEPTSDIKPTSDTEPTLDTEHTPLLEPTPLLIEIYKDKQKGDLFDFGRYRQEKNGEFKPVKWRVLRRDSDCLLVISEFCLDCKCYNEKLGSKTWENCTLRSWLNNDFFMATFNEDERRLVMSSTIDNHGKSTEDRVFLLSVDEVKDGQMFVNDGERRSKFNDSYAWWWLRSRGTSPLSAMYVSQDGKVINDLGCVVSNKGGVRPAIKLALTMTS